MIIILDSTGYLDKGGMGVRTYRVGKWQDAFHVLVTRSISGQVTPLTWVAR